MSQTNQKVQSLTSNKITVKDIFTRSKFWEKPQKEIIKKGKPQKELNEDYRNLVFFTQWKWWQKDYKFLPTPDKFVEIKKDFLENNWSNLENISHYI